MEENVLFNPQGQNQAASTQPVSPVTTQAPQQAPPPQTPPVTPPTAQPPTQGTVSSPPPIRHSPLGLILKILGVIVILSLIGFLVFRFVLPRLSGNGAGGKVTLTYWGLWETDGVMQTIIDDFEKEHPNITVEYEQRDIDKYRQTLQTRVANGDGPDIFLFHNSWTPVFVSILSPLSTDVITSEELETAYYPVVKKDLLRQGAIYGIPSGIDTLALFVNDSIFDETGARVPKTWEDFTNVAAGVTVKEGEDIIKTYGASFGAYDNVNRAPDILAFLFAQNRVDNEDPQSTKQNITEALRFYTDFVTGGDNIQTVWDTQAPNAVVSFAGGNVAMYFGYSWDVFTIKQLSPDLSFSIHPVPYLQKEQTVASYWVQGISNKSIHQQQAQEFMKYMAQKETQEKLYSESSKVRLFGLPPARRDLAPLVADNPLVFPFVSQAETATSSYFASDTFDDGLNDRMNGYLGNAVRSIISNTSVETATDTLISGIDQILGQYGIK